MESAIFVIGMYLIPTFVAGARKHHNTPAILALNLLMGWTLFGWAAALIWALTAVKKEVAT